MTADDEASETAKLRVAQVERLLEERDRLIHDLEVHQAELEVQNQQLRDAQYLLEDSRARYSDLYDLAPVGYCMLDRAGCVTEINLTGASMLATQRGRMIGKPFALYVSEPDRAAFRTHLHRRLSTPEGPAVVELTLAGSSNPPTVIQMVSAPALDHTKTIVGCRSAFTDISDRRLAEAALRTAVYMREEFLAIVSHDLRNPLNSILLGSEVLLESAALDTKGLGHVRIISQAALRMSRMLSDLLDLSSMDAGHLSIEPKSERVEDLLLALVEGASLSANASSVRLETAVHEPDLIAYCDRDRILQVLNNIVGNAIKFTPRNGSVRIEATRRRDEIEFAVRDSGAGIEKSQLARIFDPYWQETKTAKKGIGLGLSIARGIVEVHGGRIWAESVVDRGSCFFFTLPCAPTQSPKPQADTPHQRSRARAQTGPLSGSFPTVKNPVAVSPAELGPILVVDDELDTQALLTDLLGAEGYSVVTASDGAKALDYLRQATALPCLILLDLMMPNMDGWQFNEERSHDPRLARIPVVLISGQVAARETARSLGFASYIEKPIVAASLLEMVRTHGRTPAALA